MPEESSEPTIKQAAQEGAGLDVTPAAVKPVSLEEDIATINQLLEQKTKESLDKYTRAKEDVKEIPLSQRGKPTQRMITTSKMRSQALEARGLRDNTLRVQEIKSQQMSNYATSYDINLPNVSVGSRIKTIIYGVTAAVVIFLAAVIGGGLVFGFQPYVVISDSMHPELPKNSLLIVRAVDPLTLKVGDDITHRLAGGAVNTHRIGLIEIDDFDMSNSVIRTYGTASAERDEQGKIIVPDEEKMDAPIGFDQVIGKVFLVVPGMGGALQWVQNNLIIVIVSLLGVIVVWVVTSMLMSRSRAKKLERAKELGMAEMAAEAAPAKEDVELRCYACKSKVDLKDKDCPVCGRRL
ncbi:MAG: hypothetical protein FWE53_01375 [Firmicutes bacterium]|nr:hypothetical protein [Bacillota bacterium]